MNNEVRYLNAFNLGSLSYIRGRIGWKGLKSHEYTEFGPFLVAGTHIKGDKIQWDECQHINQFRYDESPEIKLNLLDIIISKDGTIGRVALVDYLLGPTTINSTMMLVRLKNQEILCSEYIFYFLQGGQFKKLVAERVAGSGVPHLFQADMKTLTVYAPEIEKQRKIAKILSTVDNLIAKTQSLIDKYTAVKQGMMADLFTRGIDLTPGDNYAQLRPSVTEAPELYQQTELGCVPKDWGVFKIEDLLNRIIDYRGKTPTKTDSGIPLLTARNVRFGYVYPEPREYIANDAYDQWMTRGIPQKGDILFTTEAPLANVAQIETGEKIAFAQRMIILQTNTSCDSSFIKYLLMSDDFRRSIFSRGSGSTVEGVKQSEFKKVLVRIPKSIDEQIQIVKALDVITHKITLEETTNNKYREIKKGLMQDLLTGKVRV